MLWCEAVRVAVPTGPCPTSRGLVASSPAARREQWSVWIADAERRRPRVPPNGYTVTALQAAWAAIRHPVGRTDLPRSRTRYCSRARR